MYAQRKFADTQLLQLIPPTTPKTLVLQFIEARVQIDAQTVV